MSKLVNGLYHLYMTLNRIQCRKYADSERKKCWEKQVLVNKKHREYINLLDLLIMNLQWKNCMISFYVISVYLHIIQTK